MLHDFDPSSRCFSDVQCAPGPEFEDIDEKLQGSFDELLAEVGVDSSKNQGLWQM